MSTNPILETARAYLAAGLSVIPVRADGSKAPVEPKWDQYAEKRAGDNDLVRWFGRGGRAGIGVCGGKASGNLAVLDFETTDAYIDWRRIVPADTTDALSDCPVVRTPSGGYHVWVRLSEPAAGTVLARRPDPDNPKKGKVLIEVRGDGHQVLAPGCPAECHKTGKLYEFVDRGWLDLAPGEMWSEVPIAIFVAWMDVAAGLNQCTPVKKDDRVVRPRPERDPSDKDPGTDFNRRGTWEETGLFDDGWKWVRELDHDRGTIRRPGKEDGISGTLGIISSKVNGWPFFWPFTSNCPAPFTQNTPYDRFGVFTRIRHKGDFAAAARALLDKGYGVATASLRPREDGSGSPPGEAGGHGGGRGPEPERPKIVITPEEHQVNDEAVESLGKVENLYQRGGSLVRAIAAPNFKTRLLDLPSGLRIEIVERATLREVLAASAMWVKEKDVKGEIQTQQAHPPIWCVDAVLARQTWKGIAPLVAVVDHPIVRPDGSILSKAGYDSQTELFMSGDALDIDLPKRPSRREAEAAAAELLDVVVDFPFVGDTDRAAWLAGSIAPLCRFAFPGPSPMLLVDANVAGTGKGLLVNTGATIVSGHRFPVASYAHETTEMEKIITALAIAGDRMVLLDDIQGPFGNSALDRALTATVWRGRVLGESRNVELPLIASWYATGNNVALTGDVARRVIMARLVSQHENPEERADFRHGPDLLDWIRTNRRRLLAAALTIPAAFLVAGSPRAALTPFGSFEGWSNLVRSAIVWAGLADPVGDRKAAREKSGEAETMGLLYREWKKITDGVCRDALSTAEIIDQVFGKDKEGHYKRTDLADLRDSLRETMKEPTPAALGYKLRKFNNRIIGGRKLQKATVIDGITRWEMNCDGDQGL